MTCCGKFSNSWFLHVSSGFFTNVSDHPWLGFSSKATTSGRPWSTPWRDWPLRQVSDYPDGLWYHDINEYRGSYPPCLYIYDIHHMEYIKHDINEYQWMNSLTFTVSFRKWSYRWIVFKHACDPFVPDVRNLRLVQLVHALSSLVFCHCFARFPSFSCVYLVPVTRTCTACPSILQCFLWTSLRLVFHSLLRNISLIIPDGLSELLRHAGLH